MLANVAGRSLTDPLFAPIWAEIDRRGLPVLVHPTDPPGVDLMDMTKFDLSWSVGFMFDTTLAITRMIFEGFFDKYPTLKIIAAHGGGRCLTWSDASRRATKWSCRSDDR